MQVSEVLKQFGKLEDVRTSLAKVCAPRDPPTTQAISSWQVKGRIPSWWIRPLLRAAARKGLTLTPEDLISTESPPRPFADAGGTAATEPKDAA